MKNVFVFFGEERVITFFFFKKKKNNMFGFHPSHPRPIRVKTRVLRDEEIPLVSGLSDLQGCFLPGVVAVSLAPPTESRMQFSLARHCRGGSMLFHRKLTSQKLDGLVIKRVLV